MRIVGFILALVLALSYSAVGMTVEKGKHAHGMKASEESACCDSPMPDIEGTYKIVTSEEVKAMLDSKIPAVLVIDARTPEEFHKVHIKGAISIPVEQLEKDVTLLTAPKDAKLVFYCNGIKCGKRAGSK
jgi:3-mercaptopyruvate sulfurtransferase SseA